VEIRLLYEGLVQLAPTFGALIGRAALVAQAQSAQAGWELLAQLPEKDAFRYQPYLALRAELLARFARSHEAREA
jgi:predicted RNA polymerase sigma factor